MCEGPETVTLDFRFQVNGTSDPDFQFPAGAVADVVRSSAGLFSITLKNKWPQMVTCTGSVQVAAVAAGQGSFVEPVSYTASTGALVVRTVDPDAAGAPAAADPSDNDWVSVRATFCRRTALMSVGSV
jgi:hypothetical protein